MKYLSQSTSGLQGTPRALSALLCVLVLILFATFSDRSFTFAPASLRGASQTLGANQITFFNQGLQKCALIRASQEGLTTSQPHSSRKNPRWTSADGGNVTLILRNASLFDGEHFIHGTVDIFMENGVIISTVPADHRREVQEHVKSIDLKGRYVTPGLVDMHSHHYIGSWPVLPSTDDVNESNLPSGPLTPFLRAVDGLKPGDISAPLIASGGVTSGLILPGSSNLLSGEAFLVKNSRRGGPQSPELVDQISLEYGVPLPEQKRFMKLAWGENPKDMYQHKRTGNAWILRKHLQRAQQMRVQQDSWCEGAVMAQSSGNPKQIGQLVDTMESSAIVGQDALEFDSTIGILRGTVSVHSHCYKSHDIESLFQIADEFGFQIKGLHHALEAWKVPGLLQGSQRNVTVATFSSFGLFKEEAYQANLWAGKILSDQGVAVAYKSDHGLDELNARYLLFQAATAHSFHLDEELALQSITSVPAKSLGIDHRVGFVRPGHDADLVVWNSHPLSIGATPLQVYIDGRETLDPEKVQQSLSKVQPDYISWLGNPKKRPVLPPSVKSEVCTGIKDAPEIVITGINVSFLPSLSSNGRSNLTMVLRDGKVACFDKEFSCRPTYEGSKVIQLTNGFVTPGMIAISRSLGMSDIILEPSTSDGMLSPAFDASNPHHIVHAKYGVHFGGKAIKRARIAGITRVVSLPFSMAIATGFWGGVSVATKISEDMDLLNGGVFQEDVSLHFSLEKSILYMSSMPTISSGVAKIRSIIHDAIGQESVYSMAANGTLPVVISAQNKYDIMQVIKMKQDYPAVKFVILGGAEASLIGKQLAKADIPVILQSFRGGPSSWEKKDMLPGPPLSQSQVTSLHQAGVLVGLSIAGLGDSHIHNLALEASWAGIYAGLSAEESFNLVSVNIERILGLRVEDSHRDFVVYEGNPLQFGASVALAIDGDTKKVVECWPEAQ
ncbi:hypothetical protein BDV19DRAFT_397207 [Aspergillus venezuelensis]